MKYFTDEKYQDDTAWLDYERYCSSIWEELPNDLRLIHEGMISESMIDIENSIGLHDARITKYNFDEDSSSLSIELNTDHEGNLRKVYFVYENAKILQDVSSDLKGRDIESCDSDIMCHELTRNDKENFQHALLFSSGEELVINFSGFKMSYKDI